MKKTNGENGITLIALVVTIVVLLILAGITITYVLADGGVFDTAKSAATAQMVGQIQDYASQIQSDVMSGCAIYNAVGAEALPKNLEVVEDTEGTGIAVKNIQAYFPEDLFTVKASEDETVKLTIDKEAGVITNGSFEVDSKTNTAKKFTVSFTKGVPKVTELGS